MLDIAPSEFLLVAFIALVVIGPKDLPKALRVIGHWVGRARAVGRQFRSGFDEMVREAELAEMEKKWKAENERIMREHAAPITDSAVSHAAGDEPAPVMVEQPQMIEHPRVEPTVQPAGSEQVQATTPERPAVDAPVTDNRAAS